MKKEHHYEAVITWTGNKGAGTHSYRAYEREHTIAVAGKPPIYASSDPSFRGDPGRHNPEELLLASLASCHMLWYLHLCADQGIVVTSYQDQASGTMTETAEGGGRFTRVLLQPVVTITDPGRVTQAQALHAEANKKCFIANSCNFPVDHQPTCLVASAAVS
ncbi:MAG: OsmC family protein [Adhaeribacter sp.]